MDYIIQIGCWSIFPSMGAMILQKSLYYIIDEPPKDSIAHSKHKKYCFIIVIISYLLYSIIQVERNLPLNYYQILHSAPSANNKELKDSFRQLSLLFHPDKIQKYGTGTEEFFVQLRDAYEVLKNPSKRILYDKFGISSCERCLTFKEYLMDQLTISAAFYIATASTGLLLTIMGSLSHFHYWRFILFVFCSTFEIFMFLSPLDPIVYIIPWRTVAEKISIMRHIFVALSIAVNQIGPVLIPIDKRTFRDYLIELEPLVLAEELCSNSALISAITPFHTDGKGIVSLRNKLQQYQMEKSLEKDSLYGNAAANFHTKHNTAKLQ